MSVKEQKPSEDGEIQQIDIDTWKLLKNTLRFALLDRRIEIPKNELVLVLRFLLERIEKGGLRVVPIKATNKMHLAMKHALDEGKRMSISWVRWRAKQRWRYQAAVDAAPNWRKGYEQETLDRGSE